MREISATRLTDMQSAFVRFMSETGNGPDSAKRAGFRPDHAAAAFYDLMRVPHVLAALQSEVRRNLVADAPMARRVIVEIANNAEISPKVRLDAAKILLERAGHVAPRAAAEKPADQPLHEMTTDQLRELAGRLEDEIAGRAKVISADTAPAPSQAIDVIG